MAVIVACFMPVQMCLAKPSIDFLKQRERNSISLELEFTRKNASPVQRLISSLGWEPNAYATGFFVGPGLVMTAYHVVSGNLVGSKKLALGFSTKDELEVKIYSKGCQARVLRVDEEADLALLEVCKTSERSPYPLFQSTLTKDEQILLIARPRDEKIVGRGTFFGSYSFNGIEYWSGKIPVRDGFSGSPVYNERGELIGVFSGYDWSQNLAVISPGERAQRLLQEFAPTNKP